MCECDCHKNYTLDTLIPQVGVITDIREETPDVKTFRVNAPEVMRNTGKETQLILIQALYILQMALFIGQ